MSGEEVVKLASAKGSKRHLPPWMQHKVGVTTLVSKPDSVVETETNCYKEKGDIAESAGNALKKNAGTGRKREASRTKSNSHAKCEGKRKRDLSQKDGSSDDVTQKEKRRKSNSSRDTVRKSSIKKGQILKLEDPIPSNGSCDNDVELTIEDLMALATEYVKDHENKEQQEALHRQCPAICESGTILDSHFENKRSSSPAGEVLYNSTPTTTGELIATSISQTGHPAQDMLDLFLGPLLRKPLEKEGNNKSIVEGLEFTHGFTRQTQDEIVGEEIVPLTKKRNTLKEKVAMFLD